MTENVTTRRSREEIIANSVNEEYNEWFTRNQKSPDNYFGVPVWSQFGKNVALRAAPELEKQAKLDGKLELLDELYENIQSINTIFRGLYNVNEIVPEGFFQVLGT